MSVINDMLRDLDKRQAPEVSSARTEEHECLIEPHASAYKKWIIFLTLLLISILLYSFFRENSDTSATIKEFIAVSDIPEVNTEKQTKIQQDQPDINALALEKTQDQIVLKNKLEPEAESVDTPKKIQKQNSKFDTELSEKEHASELVSVLKSKGDVTASDVKEDVQIHIKAQPEKQENTMEVTLSPTARDQQMAKRAANLIAHGEGLKAYRELYAFIGGNEEDVESRTVLASYLLNENRIAEVGDVLLNASISRSSKLRQIKARWYVAQNQPKLAIYTLISDLPEIEEDPDYYVLLAAYYQRYGSAKEASKTYSLLVDYDESVADWWAGLGLASDRNSEPQKAYFAYQQALELSGLSPELLNFVTQRSQQLVTSVLRANEK